MRIGFQLPSVVRAFRRTARTKHARCGLAMRLNSSSTKVISASKHLHTYTSFCVGVEIGRGLIRCCILLLCIFSSLAFLSQLSLSHGLRPPSPIALSSFPNFSLRFTRALFCLRAIDRHLVSSTLLSSLYTYIQALSTPYFCLIWRHQDHCRPSWS